ncbi:MAG: hypothetical protein M3R06_11445 [Chloroflexota bacterium]|nr:hypothetical protein [Chloroflexota bacterium]
MDKDSQAIALHGKLVDTASASETKRQSVSVTSAALISAGAAWVASDKNFVLAYLILPLMIVSAIWFVTVRYYQQLAKAKVDHHSRDRRRASLSTIQARMAAVQGPEGKIHIWSIDA